MGHHVVADVQDKVVQDIDGSEGTGIWSNIQADQKHIPAPTLSTAHFLRIASADRAQREHVKDTFHGSFLPGKLSFSDAEKKEFLEDLRQAVYLSCLASYVQGMSIIDVADRQNKWSIDYNTIIQIWRAGCIIQADYIADLLSSIFSGSHGRDKDRNLLYETKIAEDFKKGFNSLKRIVSKGIECNAVIPSISATLEYLKYSGNLDLPTQFYEAELDYFGKHMYDKKGEGPGIPETGKHHFEWKPA
jgi:6-phosphogluconate dehydrogenase